MRRVIGGTTYQLPGSTELTPFENLFYQYLPPHVRRYLVCHPRFIVKVEGTILRQDSPSFLLMTSAKSYIWDLRPTPSQNYTVFDDIEYHHVVDASTSVEFEGDPLFEIEKIPRYKLFFSRDDVRCVYESMRSHFLELHTPENPHISIRNYHSMKEVRFRYGEFSVVVRVQENGVFHFRYGKHYYLGGMLSDNGRMREEA